jgi:DNA-binding beta-propeller fold protein YncE
MLWSACSAPANFLDRPASGPVWPPPPDAPRVRFLGELRGLADLGPRRSAGQLWGELLHGPADLPVLSTPHAVAVHDDGRRVAAADTNAHAVHLFDLGDRSHRLLTELQEEPGLLDVPAALAWVQNELWVADAGLGAVVVFTDGESIGRVLIRAPLQRPSGLAWCPATETIVAADSVAHSLFVFDRSGRLLRRLGGLGTAAGEFNHPGQLACARDGRLVVADALNFRVQWLDQQGQVAATMGIKGDAAGNLALPKGVAMDDDGNIWVVDAQFENIQAFSTDGRLLMAFGGEGRGPGEFWLPAGACIDELQRLWVADTHNHRVQVFQLLP